MYGNMLVHTVKLYRAVFVSIGFLTSDLREFWHVNENTLVLRVACMFSSDDIR
jgi:hypothetical protein